MGKAKLNRSTVRAGAPYLSRASPRPLTRSANFLTASYEIVRKSTIGWISVVRPSRQPLRGFLRMRTVS